METLICRLGLRVDVDLEVTRRRAVDLLRGHALRLLERLRARAARRVVRRDKSAERDGALAARHGHGARGHRLTGEHAARRVVEDAWRRVSRADARVLPLHGRGRGGAAAELLHAALDADLAQGALWRRALGDGRRAGLPQLLRELAIAHELQTLPLVRQIVRLRNVEQRVEPLVTAERDGRTNVLEVRDVAVQVRPHVDAARAHVVLELVELDLLALRAGHGELEAPVAAVGACRRSSENLGLGS